MKDGIPYSYPSLQENTKADVTVVGSSISGALVTWYLVNAGLKVVVIDRRHAAMGSTAASTSLLQYEIDTPMHVLADRVGLQNAARSYQLCLESIFKLRKLFSEDIKTDFEEVPSLQYASFDSHIKGLRKEFELRKQHSFNVEWLEKAEINRLFKLDAPAAILSQNAAGMDAYQATHSLLQECQKMDCAIYDNTEVVAIDHHRDKVTLTTDTGATIRSKQLVLACGYETVKYIPKKIADLHSTYALVTEPLTKDKIWHKRSLVWETATPYLYFRITKDNRILMGGKDDFFYDPVKRDAAVKRKAGLIEKAFYKKFTGIDIRTDFRWAGTFATTKDGLPYIGSIRQRPNTYFALGFGGNGITYSLIAAEILCDMIAGRKNADAAIFSFDR